MNTTYAQIRLYLKKLRWRMLLVKIPDCALCAVIVFLAGEILTVTCASIMPLYLWNAPVLALLPLTFIIAFFIKAKALTLEQVAAFADSQELFERCITAIELREREGRTEQLQREDTLKMISKLNIRKICKVVIDKRLMYIGGILLLTATLIFVLPNPHREEALNQKNQAKEMVKIEKEVKELIKKVDKNETLEKEKKEKLKKLLADIRKEQKEAKSQEERNKALEKNEKKLALFKKEELKIDPQGIADTIKKFDGSEEMAEAISKDDTEEIKKLIEKSTKELAKMLPSEQKDFAEELNKLAEKVAGSGELAEAMNNLSAKMEKGELGNLDGELTQFSEAMDKVLADVNIAMAVENLEKQLAKAQSALMAGAGKEVSKGEGQTEGNGEGGGAGNGTDPGKETQKPTGEDNQGIAHKAGSEKKEGEYEKVFTPKTLGGSSEKDKLSGVKGKDGNVTQSQGEKTVGERGTDVTYDKVFGEYKASAIERMDSWEAPAHMQEIVKEYFNAIQ